MTFGSGCQPYSNIEMVLLISAGYHCTTRFRDHSMALNSTRLHGLFLYLTCDIRLSDMQHGGKKKDMRHAIS